MKFQRQLILGYDPEAGIYGDCYRTCIAILLGIDAVEVPHFVECSILEGKDGLHSDELARAWLRQRGMTMMSNTYMADHGVTTQVMGLASGGLPFMLTMQSPRGDYCHCVIAKVGEFGLEVLWCPTVCGPVKPEPYFCKDNGFNVYEMNTIVAIPESLK